MFYFNKLRIDDGGYYLERYAKCTKSYTVDSRETLENFVHETFDSSLLIVDSYYLVVCKDSQNSVISFTALYWVDGSIDLRQILAVALLSNARILDFVFIPKFNDNTVTDFMHLKPILREIGILTDNIIDLEVIY